MSKPTTGSSNILGESRLQLPAEANAEDITGDDDEAGIADDDAQRQSSSNDHDLEAESDLELGYLPTDLKVDNDMVKVDVLLDSKKPLVVHRVGKADPIGEIPVRDGNEEIASGTSMDLGTEVGAVDPEATLSTALVPESPLPHARSRSVDAGEPKSGPNCHFAWSTSYHGPSQTQDEQEAKRRASEQEADIKRHLEHRQSSLPTSYHGLSRTQDEQKAMRRTSCQQVDINCHQEGNRSSLDRKSVV